MKRQILVFTLVVSLLLTYGCDGPTETPNLEATVEARVALTATADATDQDPGTSVAPCPFYVYADWGSDLNHYVPEGWMGDVSDIAFDDNYQLDPERPSVIRITYTPTGSNQFAGVYWWDPPGGDWAKVDGGFDLSCATKLTFWARGEEGGEKAEFKVGGLRGTYQDSLQPALSTGPITLESEWKQYTLDLAGEPLDHIIGGFVWVTDKPSNPNGATIYIDDIRFEK